MGWRRGLKRLGAGGLDVTWWLASFPPHVLAGICAAALLLMPGGFRTERGHARDPEAAPESTDEDHWWAVETGREDASAAAPHHQGAPATSYSVIATRIAP